MKSFSVLTKEELCKAQNENSCCDTAELAGMLLFGGGLSGNEIKFTTENPDVFARFNLLCKLSRIDTEIIDNSLRYTAAVKDKMQIDRILKDFELTDPTSGMIKYRIASGIVADECCRRSFVKGVFLGGGTVIDPNKTYNLEIVTPYMGLSREFSQLLKGSGFEAKVANRKSKYVLYIKSSETIADFLTYIGAYKAQMELINIKIEKEIRNDFNRSINSETANWEKTINASVRQVQAIELIDEKVGIDELPEDLKDLARLRLGHKSKSLIELGALLNPPLGKSGVNHRFQRIIAMAERLSEESEE